MKRWAAMQLAGENTSSGSGRPGPTRGLAGVLNRGTRARSAEGGERGESGSESEERGRRGAGGEGGDVGKRRSAGGTRPEQSRIAYRVGLTVSGLTTIDGACAAPLCCWPMVTKPEPGRPPWGSMAGGGVELDGPGSGIVDVTGDGCLSFLPLPLPFAGGLRGGSRRRRSRVLLGAVEGLPVGWVRGCSMREAAGWGRCRTVSGRESGQGGGTQSTYGDFLKAAQCRHQVGREGESVCARAREAGERRAGEGGATGDGGRATRRRRVCSGCSSHRLEKVGGSESARGSDDLAQST